MGSKIKVLKMLSQTFDFVPEQLPKKVSRLNQLGLPFIIHFFYTDNGTNESLEEVSRKNITFLTIETSKSR